MKSCVVGRRLLVLLWAGLLTAGCSESSNAPGGEETVSAAQELTMGGWEPEFGQDRDREFEGTGEEVVVPEIQVMRWEEADAHRQIARERLRAEQLEAVDGASVPALLPDKDAYIERAITMYDEHWFAAAIGFEEHDVSITGTRMFYFVPGVSDMQKEEIEGANDHVLTRESGIVNLSFQWFGASYFIEVACARPFEDVRCTEDAYVMDLAESLAVVAGGKR